VSACAALGWSVAATIRRQFETNVFVDGGRKRRRGDRVAAVQNGDARTDRFLILDVSRYAYPPVWVPAARLWNAMKMVDSDSGMSRGFVVIRSPATAE
jgi:hypothetical protein